MLCVAVEEKVKVKGQDVNPIMKVFYFLFSISRCTQRGVASAEASLVVIPQTMLHGRKTN